MPKAPAIPKDDPGKCAWLLNFSSKLPNHATTVGVAPAEVANTQADNLYFAWVCKAKDLYAAATQQWTAYKNAAREGTQLTLGDLPAAPDLSPIPDPVAPGIFVRAAALAARIKKHPGYTEAIARTWASSVPNRRRI